MPPATDQSDSDNHASGGLLTQKEYARRRGWSKQYVNQLVKQGRIPLQNGRIDVAAADAAIAGSRDPSRSPQSPSTVSGEPFATPRAVPPTGAIPGTEGTFTKARTVREHFRALREKMEFEAATGELVRRREVEDMAYEIGVMFRQHMMRAAESIGGELARRLKVDEREVIGVVTAGIAQALHQLHDSIRDNEMGFDTGLAQSTKPSEESSNQTTE